MCLYPEWIQKTYNSIIKREIIQYKIGKHFNRSFKNKTYEWTNKQIKRWSITFKKWILKPQ